MAAQEAKELNNMLVWKGRHEEVPSRSKKVRAQKLHLKKQQNVSNAQQLIRQKTKSILTQTP